MESSPLGSDEPVSSIHQLEEKDILSVYVELKRSVLPRVHRAGYSREDGEDIISETIRALIVQSSKEVINNPAAWAETASRYLWLGLIRRGKRFKTFSFDGTAGISHDGLRESLLGLDDTVVGDDHLKTRAPLRVREDMMSMVTESHDPARIAEDRDWLQKIDDHWQEHLEEGLDGERNGKLEPLVKKRIRYRAMKLVEGMKQCLHS